MNTNTANLIPLTVPVPPEPLLEDALGYTGKARYFAAWWQPEGDESMTGDGLTTTTGQWMGYLSYIQHARVAPMLMNYCLGSSDGPADHWLIFDRQERKAYIALRHAAQKFLSSQWPTPTSPINAKTLEELGHVINRWLSADNDVTVADVLAWMESNRKAVAALDTWLDEQEEPARSAK